jgi:DNA-binding response OmpR family regulator
MPHYKVLVIDYEPRGVAQLRDPLHAAGYLVSVAHDGVSGMKLFEEIEPDLTLIEAMLPKKHGFEVCRDLKQTPHGAKSPVVIVTSVYRGRKYRNQAFHNYHCDEFLEKPISSSTLLSTVERLLEQRQAVPAAAAAAAPEAAKPEPAPAAQQAEAPQVEPVPVDEAEAEISERLDELLGGDPDSGPLASTSSRGENLLLFDPERSRRASTPSEAIEIPHGPSVSAPRLGGSAAAEVAPDERSDLLPRQARIEPAPSPESWPRRRHEAIEPGETGPRGYRLLLWTILIAALASSALFLLLRWPF